MGKIPNYLHFFFSHVPHKQQGYLQCRLLPLIISTFCRGPSRSLVKARLPRAVALSGHGSVQEVTNSPSKGH